MFGFGRVRAADELTRVQNQVAADRRRVDADRAALNERIFAANQRAIEQANEHVRLERLRTALAAREQALQTAARAIEQLLIAARERPLETALEAALRGVRPDEEVARPRGIARWVGACCGRTKRMSACQGLGVLFLLQLIALLCVSYTTTDNKIWTTIGYGEVAACGIVGLVFTFGMNMFFKPTDFDQVELVRDIAQQNAGDGEGIAQNPPDQIQT